MRDDESRVPQVECDWSEISELCRKLSALLDRHDGDRFAQLFRLATG